jgi:subtilisin family serine protease
MAAPIVAGVIALMLDKKPDLNTDQVRTHLTAITGPPVKPTGADGDRAYGKGMVNALESHKHVT